MKTDYTYLEEIAQLDIRCRLNQYREILELTDFGFKGIFQGDNPRTLGNKLLFFIKESDRHDVKKMKIIQIDTFKRVDSEIQEFTKLEDKVSNEELLSRYRMFDTDYFLKNSKIGFSSWHYVEQQINSKEESNKKRPR
ncbi:MAG: hypothetical protein PHQ22_09905 [Sulfuricurvum sp.]|nr:hypothetical protein [Sulfuricurvum sp.]MDD5387492.1 hypothetical protein [Sulfuricurvum sp.]